MAALLIVTVHDVQVSPPSTFPRQQVPTCVWDVSAPFKIVLVNASKVNAEETAKVNTHLVYIHGTVLMVPVTS